MTLLELAQIPATTAQQADTVSDSIGAGIEQLGESVSQTGEMLVQGDWSGVWAKFITYLTDLGQSFVPNLLSAIFVGAVFFVVFRALHRLLARVLSHSRGVNAGMERLIMNTMNVAGIAFISVLVLSQLGVNIAALIAGLGIAGIALGFAAKDTLENFIAGVTILLDRPFAVGHWVEIDGTYGEVTDLTLRSSRIRTLGNRILVLPNVMMINRALTNFSMHLKSTGLRVDVPFSIAYKERPAEARSVVLATTEGDDRLMADPAPEVVVTSLGESSVDMALRVHVEDAGLEYPIRFAYAERIREALREAEIEIPFPHLQVHLDSVAGLREDGGLPLKIVQDEPA